jgi:hypothetical protein
MKRDSAPAHRPKIKGKLRNFRFREDLDEFLSAESTRTGKDMTLYIEQALAAFKKLKPTQRDTELQKAMQ